MQERFKVQTERFNLACRIRLVTNRGNKTHDKRFKRNVKQGKGVGLGVILL